MTHIRKSALALCLVLLFSGSSNSQTTGGTTGNLTNFTGAPTDTTSVWNNAGSVGQPLTCWAAGDPGYCGPGPRVSAWGAGSNIINFSYGQTDLNQVVNINKALSIGGSGVQLSGFNFGFQAKNGNGWDNGQQDYLSAYVKLSNSAGSTVQSYDYTSQTNNRYNWTNFNFSETFATPYTASKLGNIQYGFVGRDNNFWVGPYGPEITNVSFSLAYSVKPAAPPTVPAPPPAYAPPLPPAYAPPPEASPSFAQASPQQQAQQPPPPPPPRAGPGPGQDPSQNPSMAQDAGGPMQGPQQAGPAPTQPQPAGGPPQTTSASASSSSGSSQAGSSRSNDGPKMAPGAALSIARAAQEKDKAVQAVAVQNAAKTFEGTQQSAQAASNAAITMNQDMSSNSATAAANFASQTTQSSQQNTMQSMQSQGTAQQSSTQSSGTRDTQSTQQTNSGTGLTFNGNLLSYNSQTSTNTSNTSLATLQTAPIYQPRAETRQLEVEQAPIQMASFGGVSRAGNPLSDIMNQRLDMMQTNIDQRADTVKKNVQPNELAGGVDVAAMAQIPRGYEVYSVVTLRDAPFYKPETIYKDNRTVDNARLLRGLTGGSDAKHQQMVDSQYKIGN